jgi:hypothetical protein
MSRYDPQHYIRVEGDLSINPPENRVSCVRAFQVALSTSFLVKLEYVGELSERMRPAQSAVPAVVRTLADAGELLQPSHGARHLRATAPEVVGELW